MSGAFDPRTLAAPGVTQISPYQPGKPVEELEAELGIRDVIKLASNENPLGLPASARRAIDAALAGLGRYPDGSGTALRRTLAAKLEVDPAQITLGNGSNDVLELAARAFATPADEVLFSAHAFAVYPLVTLAIGATPVIVPAHGWGHDLAAMAERVTAATRVVFVANPNNPTGTYCTAGALRDFLDRMPAHVVVVVDEAYFEYVGVADYPDCMGWLPAYANLIVTRTFSKIYALAGVRAGYCVSSLAIADLLNRIRQPFNMNTLAQVAARAALADTDFVERSQNVNREQMQVLCAATAELGIGFIPSVGNFLSVDLGRPAAPVYEALLRQGVIVRPVADYAMPNHLRITFGRPAQMRRAIDALAAALAATASAA